MTRRFFRKANKESMKEKAIDLFMAVFMAIIISVIFILALGESPLHVFTEIGKGAFRSSSSILEILAKATPIITIGLGICVASSAGMTNLGGDGQFYIGAIASVIVGLYLNAPPIIVWLLAILVAILAGGAWGGIAGLLRSTLGTSEVIITIMMNYIALYLIGFLISNPLQAPGGIPQTKALADHLHFPKLMLGSRAHWGIIIVILLAAVVSFVMNKTVFGFKMTTIGKSPKAAEYGGIETKKLSTLSLFIAGAFAGLAGMIEVYGTYYRVLEGITSSFGFTAVMIAILANNKPLGVIVGSVLLSTLTVGVNAMQIEVDVPTSIVTVIQGVVVFSFLVMPAIRANVSGSLIARREAKLTE